MASRTRRLAVTAMIVGASLAGPAVARAAEPALRIASVETLTGPGSTVNRLWTVGLRYAIERLNAEGGWHGRPVELREYDSQGTTAVAAEKLRAAIADGAHVVVHGGSSAIAGQITEDVRKHNLRNPDARLLFLSPGAEALELTGEKCHFYFFRSATNAEMRVRALVTAMRAAGDLGKKVFSINQNYSWGKDVEAAVERMAPAGGYTVVDKVLHDVNRIQDFSPFAARLAASGADTAVTGNWGNDLTLLLKAVASAGVKVKFATTFLDLPGSLSAAGDAALGYYAAEMFNPAAFGKRGADLVAAYKAKVGAAPSTSEIKMVLLIDLLRHALAAVPPTPKPDVTAIALALEKATLDLPTGPVTVRAEDHQVVWPMIVAEVSKRSAFPHDGTDMGFEPVDVVPGPAAINPVQPSCRMERPR